MSKEVLLRKDVKDEHKWAIHEIYASNEAFEEDLKALKEKAPVLMEYKGKLHEKEALLSYLKDFETYTRNTLDLAAIPVLRHLTHLPVIIDPSHATGKNALVAPLAMGAVATGCDGLLIEVHNDPAHALSDGPQSLNPEAFDKLNHRILALYAFMTSGEGKA